jgi:hypothetical protein
VARAHKITAANATRARWEKHHADPASWFWKRVDKTGGPNACWPWTGRVMTKRGGYGRLKFLGREVGAHRFALEITTGESPAGLFACHSCDNPICCNPQHLRWGTHQDNVNDKVSRGRSAGAHRKINVDLMIEMRQSGATYKQIADEMGVAQSSVGRALERHAALRARAEMESRHG